MGIDFQSNAWEIVAAAYAGGFLSALTPCVYPLIPVTAGLLGVRTSRILLFILGLVSVYASLGFAAAATGRLLGQLTQTPAIVGLVALVFFVMGFGMLGAFHFRLPRSLSFRLTRLSPTGRRGAFLMGGASGLLAAPCSGPVAVGILAYVAQKSNPAFGALLLLVFSLGMGTPFLLLAGFSGLLVRLPRGGAWTEGAERLAGLALIVASFLFLRPVISPEMFQALMLGFLVAVIGFAPRLFREGSLHLRRGIQATALVMILLLFGTLAVPRRGSAIRWMDSETEALIAARAQGKPILIDFWAEWCTSCLDLERETYADPRVGTEVTERFVPVKIDATEFSEEVQRLMRKYGVTGLPAVLFADPEGKLLPEFTRNGFVDAESFLEILRKVRLESGSRPD